MHEVPRRVRASHVTLLRIDAPLCPASTPPPQTPRRARARASAYWKEAERLVRDPTMRARSGAGKLRRRCNNGSVFAPFFGVKKLAVARPPTTPQLSSPGADPMM
jgi:hypothetical protein